MSKYSASHLDRAAGEPRDDELEGMSGGLVVIAIIGILIGQLLPSPPPGGKPGIGPV